MPLKGITVVELVGLAPGPYCGQVLADFGAQVIRVDKAFAKEIEVLKRGKDLLLIDLKTIEGKEVFKTLCKTADVVIEPFRPGVMERLGLGPEVLMSLNERLIYVRISGYGQTGHMSQKAGHDINYLSICGILSKLGPKDRPLPPLNLLADFGGGGLMAALGVCLALIERHKSGRGQVIDANLTEGTAYLCSWVWESLEDNWVMKDKVWPQSDQRMGNTLDGASPFYRCYQTKDHKYMSVGAFESKFYQNFVQTLGLDLNQCLRNDVSKWEELNQKFETIFLTKTQNKWIEVFNKVDACVTPVLDIKSVHKYRHNVDRDSYFPNGRPKPSPKLSQTPASGLKADNENTDCLQTKQILLKLGFSEREIKIFCENKIIEI